MTKALFILDMIINNTLVYLTRRERGGWRREVISASFSCGDGGAALTTGIFKYWLGAAQGCCSPPHKHPQASTPGLALLEALLAQRSGCCQCPLGQGWNLSGPPDTPTWVTTAQD